MFERTQELQPQQDNHYLPAVSRPLGSAVYKKKHGVIPARQWLPIQKTIKKSPWCPNGSSQCSVAGVARDDTNPLVSTQSVAGEPKSLVQLGLQSKSWLVGGLAWGQAVCLPIFP